MDPSVPRIGIPGRRDVSEDVVVMMDASDEANLRWITAELDDLFNRLQPGTSIADQFVKVALEMLKAALELRARRTRS